MAGSEEHQNDRMDLDGKMANGRVTSAHCWSGTKSGRKASLDALPFELMEMVLNSEILTRPDFVNLAQVSRIFPHFSAPRLYPEYVLRFHGGLMVPIDYERLLRPDNPGRKEVRRLRVVQIDKTAHEMTKPWRDLGTAGPFRIGAKQLCEQACTMVVSVLRQLDPDTLREFTWDLPIPLSPTLQHYLEVYQPNLEILKVQHALNLSHWNPQTPPLPRMNNLTQLSLSPRLIPTLNHHVATLLRRSLRIHTLEFDQSEYQHNVHEAFEDDMRDAPTPDHTRSVWAELERIQRAELEESERHIPSNFRDDRADDLIRRSNLPELHTLHLREFSVYNLCGVIPMANLRTLTLIEPPNIYDLFSCWEPEERRLHTFTLVIRKLPHGDNILTLMTAIEDFLLSFTGLHSLRFINEMAHRCIRSQREPVLQTHVMAHHTDTLETLVLASRGREGGSRTVYPLPLDRLLEYTMQFPRLKRLGVPAGYETLGGTIDLLGQVAPNVEWLVVANHKEHRWPLKSMEEFAWEVWKAAGVQGRLKVLVLGGEVKYKPHYFLVQTGEDGESEIKFVGKEKEGREVVEKAMGGGDGVDTVIW